MRKLAMLLALVLLTLVTTTTPARAITGDYVDDFEHPFVGLISFLRADGLWLGRCSGSLLSPHVFLTAGHCVAGGEDGVAASAIVYFDQDAGVRFDGNVDEGDYDPVTGYPIYCLEGALCTHAHEWYNYGYPGSFPETRDVALVILDEPIELPEYGVLAAAGSLDRLATKRGRQEITLTLSGFGWSEYNPQILESFRKRLMAESQVLNLRSALTDGYNLQWTGNPGIGGGACLNDSGGPAFYGDFTSNIIVAVISFRLASPVCKGTDFGYRTDQAAVIDWILAHSPPEERALIQVVGL